MAVDIASLKQRLPQVNQAKIEDASITALVDQAKTAVNEDGNEYTTKQADSLILELASYYLAVSLGASYGVDPAFYLDLFKNLKKSYLQSKRAKPIENRFDSIKAGAFKPPRNFA